MPFSQNLAARRQQRCVWRHHAAERHEIVLVAPGSVQQQERGRVGLGAFFEAMNVG